MMQTYYITVGAGHCKRNKLRPNKKYTLVLVKYSRDCKRVATIQMHSHMKKQALPHTLMMARHGCMITQNIATYLTVATIEQLK